MGTKVCGKDAEVKVLNQKDRMTEGKKGLNDKIVNDMPICGNCLIKAKGVAASLNRELETVPIDGDAQPIDKICLYPTGRVVL